MRRQIPCRRLFFALHFRLRPVGRPDLPAAALVLLACRLRRLFSRSTPVSCRPPRLSSRCRRFPVPARQNSVSVPSCRHRAGRFLTPSAAFVISLPPLPGSGKTEQRFCAFRPPSGRPFLGPVRRVCHLAVRRFPVPARQNIVSVPSCRHRAGRFFAPSAAFVISLPPLPGSGKTEQRFCAFRPPSGRPFLGPVRRVCHLAVRRFPVPARQNIVSVPSCRHRAGRFFAPSAAFVISLPPLPGSGKTEHRFCAFRPPSRRPFLRPVRRISRLYSCRVFQPQAAMR